MSHATPQAQARLLAQQDGLPFEELLPEQEIRQVFQDLDLPCRNGRFNPITTLWMCLSQCLDSVQCLRKALARFLAFRSARGLAPGSADPSGYNKARHRLPEPVLRQLTRQTGSNTETEGDKNWLWKGRRVHVVDGSTVSMPDTTDNQDHYPQPRSQKPGLGFPLMRIVVVFSLAVGTVLEAALAPYCGKGTGETALLWQLLDTVVTHDVLLGDRYFCTFWVLSALRQRKADGVFRLHSRRSVDLRRGIRLGKEDRCQVWSRPKCPEWMTPAEYMTMPRVLYIRLFRVHVRRRGFRTRTLMIATTLLDATIYSKSSIAALYRRRWEAELHLRSLKQTVHMDVLRGESAAVVRLELWAHLLAYNLIRRAMAQAGRAAGLDPLRISFAGAVQIVLEYLGQLLLERDLEKRHRLWQDIRALIRQHRVGDRPDRIEPREVKRRPKQYKRLNRPRAEARSRLEKGAFPKCGSSHPAENLIFQAIPSSAV